MAAPDELNQRLQALWQKFHPEMLSRMETIADTIQALKNGTLPETVRMQAIYAAHKLAGSLGTFGLHKGSEAAQEIERLLSAKEVADNTPAAIARYFDLIKKEIASR